MITILIDGATDKVAEIKLDDIAKSKTKETYYLIYKDGVDTDFSYCNPLQRDLNNQEKFS